MENRPMVFFESEGDNVNHMRYSLSQIPNLSEKPPFNVLIIYSDTISGVRAIELYQGMVDRFGDDFVFKNSMVDICSLADPSFAEQSTHDASSADMVIVCVDSESALSPTFKAWSQNWIIDENRDHILVSMGEIMSPDRSSRNSWLRSLAQRHHMDFLSNLDSTVLAAEPSERQLASLTTDSVPRWALAPLPDSRLGWGINE